MTIKRTGLIAVCLVSLATALPAQAQQGDCNNNGVVDLNDMTYLTTYLFMGGPPPGDPDNDGIPNC